ncbi:hypothetical protein BX600DRAFT_467431 [Xylariales sp. PMI_506]|nr:hypothetical protein BX600DRAFT_467431 [Xylariales sp. PMI_506]
MGEHELADIQRPNVPQHSRDERAKSSRHVSEMSLEKLYRKRALDRQNQRELRHKKKARMLELEEQVEELKRRLADSESQRQHLEASKLDTSMKIDRVVSILATIGQSGDHLGLAGHSHYTPDLPAGTHSTVSASDEITSALLSESGNEFAFQDLPAPWNSLSSVVLPIDSADLFGFNDFSVEMSILSSTCELAVPGQPTTENETWSSPPQFSGETSGPPNMKRVLKEHTHPEFHEPRIKMNMIRDATPIWSIVPRFTDATCNMDHLIMDLIHESRQESDRSKRTKEFSSNFPSVESLLNPVLYNPEKPVASTIASHVAKVTKGFSIPEKIAMVYMISILIRWYIRPTEENYDAIPEFLRPTTSQLLIQHPAWIDTVGWPGVRERLIRYMDFKTFPKYASLLNLSFSINWPHNLSGILEKHSNEGFVVTQDFIRHIRDINNWTVGQALIDAYPFLKGAVNVNNM